MLFKFTRYATDLSLVSSSSRMIRSTHCTAATINLLVQGLPLLTARHRLLAVFK